MLHPDNPSRKKPGVNRSGNPESGKPFPSGSRRFICPLSLHFLSEENEMRTTSGEEAVSDQKWNSRYLAKLHRYAQNHLMRHKIPRVPHSGEAEAYIDFD
jgi:hypothetical protein